MGNAIARRRRLVIALVLPAMVLMSMSALTSCKPGADCDPAVFFPGANLAGANLTGKQLSSCDLSGADLSRANLTNANLQHANLTGTNLLGANLTGADLTAATLTDANLVGAVLTNSKGPGNGTAAAAKYSPNTRCADGAFHGASCVGYGTGW